MADGRTHFKYLRKGWYIIIPLGVFMFLFGGYLYPLFLYLNFFLCRYIDPDDDQKSLTGSEGRTLRESRKVYMGFLGALFVAYGFVYAYIAGLFGGHRSWFSHGIGKRGMRVISTGTFGRIIFYNIPLYIFLNTFYSLAITHWGWSTSVNLWKSFYMNIWFVPYIVTQLVAWFIGDTIHLILDTEWAKGTLYDPSKTGAQRYTRS